MVDASSLYPQPPQQQQNSLASNPGAIVNLMQGINALRSKQAIGGAFQGAIGANGQFDPVAAAQAIKSNPDAAWGAPEAVGTLLDARGKQISNSTAQFGLQAAQNQEAQRLLAGFAQDPNPSDDKIRQWSTSMARAGIDPSTINGMRQDLLARPMSDRKNVIGNVANTVMGPGTAAQATTPAIGPQGAQYRVPLGATTAGGGGYQAGLAPGYEQAAGAAGVASAAQAVDLGKAADTSPIRKGMLGNLESDLNAFTSGPSADWQKVGKAWANRNILPSGMQFDPTSIASQEAFTKQAEQLAQQQFAAIGGTGTDAKFGSAFKSNPNDALSNLGNKGIIRLLKGNEDAIQAKNNAWQEWQKQGNPPNSYPQFAAEFNSKFDPRVFQAQYMSREDFSKTIKGMSGPEQRQFIAKVNEAKQRGHVAGPGSYYNGQ